MGSSFIVKGEKGFWARDTELQFLLKLAVNKMVQNPTPDPELNGLRQIWQSVASEPPSGALDLQLDELITDASHRDKVVQVIGAALGDLALRGDMIKKEELSVSFGEPFRGDLPTSHVKSVGEALVALLRDEPRSILPQIVSRHDPNWRGEQS